MSEYQGRRRAAEPAAERKRRVSPRWLGLLAVLIWFVIGGVGGPLVGRLAEVQTNDNASFVPASAESTEVARFVEKASDTNDLPYLIVLESGSEITPQQQERAAALASELPRLPLPELGPGRTVGEFLGTPSPAPIPSADKRALLLVLNLDSAKADDTINSTTPMYETALEVRKLLESDLAGSGLTGYLAGPGGLLADFVTAFEGIDGVLLGVALSVVSQPPAAIPVQAGRTYFAIEPVGESRSELWMWREIMRRVAPDLQMTMVMPPHNPAPTDLPANVTVIPTRGGSGNLGKVLFEQRAYERV